jgi:hypothetical protein
MLWFLKYFLQKKTKKKSATLTQIMYSN